MVRAALRNFTVQSIIVIGIIAVAAAYQVADLLQRHILETYSQATVSQVRGPLSSVLSEKDLESPLAGDRYRSVHAYINKIASGTNIVKLAIWREDGVILFSNNQKLVGKRFNLDDPLRVAFQGGTYWRITDLEDAKNVDAAREYRRLIEISYPVSFDESKPNSVSAVYQIYLALTPVEYYVNSAKRIIYISFGILVAVFIVLAEVASRRLRRSAKRLAVVAERERIAQESHDRVMNRLSAVALQLEMPVPAKSARGSEGIADIPGLLRETVTDMRQIVAGMQPAPASGIQDEIGKLLLRRARQYGISTTLSGVLPSGQTLSPRGVTLILDCLDEAIANAVRHGRASAVRVELGTAGCFSVVRVIDDGSGFAPPDGSLPLLTTAKRGLAGMRARVKELGGELKIESGPGDGTLLEFSWKTGAAQQRVY